MAQYNRFMGGYDDNTNYEKGDVVTFDGAAWYRKLAGSGISPIARKKPYTVWSRLNQDLSTIFPLGGSGGAGASFHQVYTDMTPGYVSAKTGAFGTGGNWQRTDYIPVSSGDVVTFSGRIGDSMGVAGYDENKAFVASVLDRINLEGGYTYENEPLTIPDGVKYIAGCTISKAYPIKVTVYKDAKALVEAGGTGLPSDVGAYKYMATDGEGQWQPVDRLGWKDDYVDFSFGITPGASEKDPQLPEGATLVRDNPNYVTVTYPADNYFTGNLSWLIGRVITFVGADASKTYTITAADIDSEGNLLCEYVGGCQLNINSSTGVVVLQVGVTLTGGVFFSTQPAAIVERIYHPIPAEYLPTTFVPTVIIKSGNYDSALSGLESGDPTVFECLNMTFEDALAHFKSGKPLTAVAMVSDKGYAFCAVCDVSVQVSGDVSDTLFIDGEGVHLVWTLEGGITEES